MPQCMFLLHRFISVAAEAAAEGERRLSVVAGGLGVVHAERAINTITIFQRHLTAIVVFMAVIAHVVCTKAFKDGNGAAVHAFPVNLFPTMFLTVFDSGADFLD